VHAARAHHAHCFTTELAALDGRSDAALADGAPRLDAYYLQPAWLHRRFGGMAFRGYVSARALVRSLRAAGPVRLAAAAGSAP
jgi:hypothetical protein